MILKPIKKEIWQFYAICDYSQSCPLLTWIGTIPKDQRASAKKLLAIIYKASGDRHGPLLLSKDVCHRVNDKHAINEFIAGKLRLLWFYSSTEKKVIICSVGFRKKTQKTPKKFIDAAVRDKKAYIEAVNNNDIKILED